MLPGRMSSLPPLEESGPTLNQPAVERIGKNTLFNLYSLLPEGLRRHAEGFVVPRKSQELGSRRLTNHSAVHLRTALTSACSVWQSQWLLLPQIGRERLKNCRQKHYLSLTTEDLRLGMGIRKLTMIGKIRLGNKPTETSNIREG